jgi:hypothetical protein
MYLGKIVRTYIQGSVIPVKVVVSFQIILFLFYKTKENESFNTLVNSKSYGRI